MGVEARVFLCKPLDDCQNSLKVAGGREIESLCTGLFHDRMIGLIIAMLEFVGITWFVHNY